jgi:hypothetical protein
MNFKRKILVNLTTLITAYIRLNYMANAFETAEVFMTPNLVRF